MYGKRVRLLPDQALQPLLKKNRARKHYSARLTRWLDRLSHFVNVQFTAGKTSVNSLFERHPIVPTELTELENKADGQNDTEAEEEFVVNEIYGHFEFNQTRGGIKQFTEQVTVRENSDQSQSDKNISEQNQNNHLLKTSSLSNSINSNASNKTLPSSTNQIDKVNGLDMDFIYKKRGHSLETKRLWVARNHILKPDKTRIVAKGKKNERIQEY